MAVRVIICIAFLLVFFKVEVMGSQRTHRSSKHSCSTQNQLANCTNNYRINITKHDDYYRLHIRICSNHQCTHGLGILDDRRWIECYRICDACNSLMIPGCGSNKPDCEQKVDDFLNSYCNKVTLAIANPYPSITSNQCSTTTNNVTITVSPTSSQPGTLGTTQCSAATLTTTVSPSCSSQPNTLKITQCSAATLTTTVSPSCSQSKYPWPVAGLHQPTSPAMPMESPSSSSSSLESTEKSTQTTNTVTALGVLLGLSVMLLVLVTTGWMCTCLIMKKRNSKVVVNTNDGNDEERIFQNPTYEGTSTTQPQTSNTEQENLPMTTYDTVTSPSQAATENGQTYDVLNRGQASGNNPARASDSGRPHRDENYSQLGQFSD